MTSKNQQTKCAHDEETLATKRFVRQENEKMVTILVEIKAELEETRRHFDVVAENIHKAVASANQDQLSLIADQKLPDHEQRITDLERQAGLPTGPRHAPIQP